MKANVMRRRANDARIAKLGTVDSKNRPHIVPCCFVIVGETLFSPVDHVKPKSNRTLKRLRNIEQQPTVTVLVDHYDEDWRELWWIRLDGTAAVAQTSRHRGPVIELLVTKYPQYDSASFRNQLIVVQISRWTGWP
ncbi:MAG: TIGR03668 family PPOX class F420-dependent oxidoreductase [Acidimicrobiales bacterium]